MVILIDQRNHGKSPHVDGIDYPTMAEDLHAFMESNWIHEASILGHSMGGKVAIEFAKLYPDMVDKLFVIDISPKENRGGHERIFEAMLSLDVERMTARSEAENHLKKYIMEEGVLQFLMKNLHRQKEGGYAWKMNLTEIHRNYPRILEAIPIEEPMDVPTTIVYGTRSSYILEKDIPLIKEQFTDLSLYSLPTGHWVHAEQPDELLKIVLKELNG